MCVSKFVCRVDPRCVMGCTNAECREVPGLQQLAVQPPTVLLKPMWISLCNPGCMVPIQLLCLGLLVIKSLVL